MQTVAAPHCPTGPLELLVLQWSKAGMCVGSPTFDGNGLAVEWMHRHALSGCRHKRGVEAAAARAVGGRAVQMVADVPPCEEPR